MPYRDDHLLRSAHTRMFGVEPELVTHAPGRVNIIGEHIDYSRGIVLPLAIDRHASVGISRSTDPAMVRIHALDLEEFYENTLDGYQSDPPGPGHWVHYILGPLVMLEEISLDRGIDLTCTSNVPIGAGLSSSAALEVAAARAASELLQLRRTPIELAKCCQQGEHRFAGVPCGLMDQATAAIAPAGTMLAFDCKDESWRVLNRPPDMGLIVIDSGVRHALGESAYRDRREAATQAADSLGWRSLRAAMDRGATDKLDQLPDHQRDAAQHAFSEMGRAADAIKAIQSGDLRRLGMLMNESHDSLRDTLRVSCGEVDQLVDTACQHPSVLGARMTGGGFGGCVLVLVPSVETEIVAHEIIGACPSGINASIVPIDASTD